MSPIKFSGRNNRLTQLAKWVVCGLGAFAAAKATAASGSDPLLDVLIKKGIITQQEADEVKTEAQANQATNAMPSAASKWKLSEGIKNIELFGDLRFRYEYRAAKNSLGGQVALERYRYALRVGLRGDLFDDFYYGLRLETSANPRSPWATLGTSSSGTPYQGPSGKGTLGLNLGQIYVGWRPESWADITIGRMPMPLYVTPMVWDTDINPEGLAERFKFTVGKADLFANLGQFVYQDTNPSKASPGLVPSFPNGQDSQTAFLLAWQAGFNYHFSEDVSLKAAATLYNYTSKGEDTSAATGIPSGTPGFRETFVGEGNSGANQLSSGPDGFFYNQTGINDLMIIDFPFEFNFKISKLRARVFGDYAQNLDGADRAANATAAAVLAGAPAFPVRKDQNHAYQVGFAIGNGSNLGLVYGQTLKKGMWEARSYWQHVEQYSLDPNLLDSDFFEGRGNMQGVYAAFAYGFTDSIIGTFRGGYASRIDKSLGTGGSNQDIPQVNPISRYQILQFDLTYKF